MTGRELDALIAERVFGLTMANEARTFVEVPNSAEEIEGGTMVEVAFLPEYSTDIAAAWRVVEQLKNGATAWTVANYGAEWHVRVKRIGLHSEKVFFGEAADESLPVAICRAALAAMESRP